MVSADGTGMAAVRNVRIKPSRAWWSVHQWVGLKLSLLLSFVFLTGTLAVFSHEMDWLMRPAMRVDPTTASGPMDWTAAAQAVARYAPDARIQRLDAPTDRGFAATATIRRADGALAFVYVHPLSGRVQGDGHWVGAVRILRNMHRHLMMPVKWGVPIVSSLALLLVVSLATSLVVYKKWWRGFFRPIRMTDARTAFGDFHRLAGVWSLWFLALIAVTSLWYLAESLGLKAPSQSSAKAPAAQLSTSDLADRLGVSLAAARRANPHLKIETVAFPTKTSGAFVFQGQDRAILVRPRANAVWTSARTGEVLLTTDARDLSLHQRVSEAADPLHFGTWGGLPARLAWFSFGALLTGLSVSGAAVYSLRLLRAARQPSRFAAVAVLAWQGMGWWRWPAVILMLTAFVLLPGVFAAGGD